MTNRIDQPRAFDLVGDPVLVAGVGAAFEAELRYRIGDGHDEVGGAFEIGGGSGEHGQFQVRADLGGTAFRQDRLVVQVFEVSPADGREINTVSVPVIYGPRIVPGYTGYREHTVTGGETLSAIARAHYGNTRLYQWLVRANPQVTDPDVITPGQVLRVPLGG